jgi:hypothetical protein
MSMFLLYVYAGMELRIYMLRNPSYENFSMYFRSVKLMGKDDILWTKYIACLSDLQPVCLH